MTATSSGLSRTSNRRNFLGQALVVLVAAAGIALVVLTTGFLRGGSTTLAPVPLSADIEAKWGIRVTQVAVTADGGLVELRFVVLDSEKASAMMNSVNNLPVMHPDGTNLLVNSAAQMSEHSVLTAGQTYFLLYRNTSGVVKRGASLTIAFGDLHIDHVIAR